MKKILLSFKPYWYEKIKSGEKIFEYRRRFCDEPVIAYMYVSRPVMAVTGIIKLDKRIPLEDWKNKYKNDNEVLMRICDFAERNNFAMPILEFQPTNQIRLSELQKNIPGFVAPQMYYNLKEGSELLTFLETNIHNIEGEFCNLFEGSIKNEICKIISG